MKEEEKKEEEEEEANKLRNVCTTLQRVPATHTSRTPPHLAGVMPGQDALSRMTLL